MEQPPGYNDFQSTTPVHYQPAAKRGLPKGLLIALVVGGVVGIPILLAVLVLSLSVFGGNTLDAQRAEATELFSYARSTMRAGYAPTKNPNDGLAAYTKAYGQRSFLGRYYYLEERPVLIQTHRDVQLICAPTDKVKNKARGYLEFDWETGRDDGIQWR